MAVRLALLDADARRRPATRTRPARGLQRPALGSQDGAQWRMLPDDLPPWHTVYQQSRRWLKAKVFEAMVHACGNCYEWLGAGTRSLRRRFLTGAPCNPPRRAARRLRWLQAQKRQQGSHGRGHAGPAAGLAGDPGERAGAPTGRSLGQDRSESIGALIFFTGLGWSFGTPSDTPIAPLQNRLMSGNR